VKPPDPGIVRDPHVEAARQSVVRVVGTACDLLKQGSGWVAGKGVVMTNAHVVAGERHTTIELADGSRHDAEVTRYEPRNDLAVLRSSGLAARGVHPLKLRPSAPPGTTAALLGYPNGGSYRGVPARIGPTGIVVAPDSYGRGPFRRLVTALRGSVRRGDSGGPVVDGDGRVVATTFLAALPRARTRRAGLGAITGFGVPSSVARLALARAHERASTGPCQG
jgi:S1-C subfamily serine protease